MDIQENDVEEETIGVKGLDDKASNDEHKTISHWGGPPGRAGGFSVMQPP